MALKFRRGTTAQQSGSLAFGEPYVNTTLGTLLIGGPDGDIVLSATGTGSTGNFGPISGSGLDITGDANIHGNLTLGGNITIGDSTTDNVSINADLSSSIIPDVTNAFDLGSTDKVYRNIYATSISGAIAATNGVVSGSSQVIGILDSLNTFSGSALTRLTALEVETTNLESFTSSINTTIKSKLDADGVISGSSQITISDTTGFSAYSTSVDSRITTEKGRVDAILLSADADKDSFAEIVTLINSVDTTNDTAFASFYTASVGRLNNLESTSASVNISVSNLNTYTGSNDTTNTTQNTRLTALEASASTALSTNNTQATSITNLNSTTASLNTSVSNLNSFSSSALTRLSDLEGKDFTITLTGDVTGTGTVTNLGNVSFATTVAANSVTLGTDTTGDYVASLVAGTGITLSNNSGEGATPTIAIGQAVATSSTPTFAGLTINGAITATGDITAYYSSDRRYKNNIQPIENALDKVKTLTGVTWEWNDDVSDVTKAAPKTGLIAQEVQLVLPEVVKEKEDGYLGLDYAKMMGLLVEAIKEQQSQIEELKSKLGYN